MVDLDNKVSSALSEIGQRYSSGRKNLVSVLAKAKSPLGIHEIADADENLAQSSIYRNLTVLEEAGVVRRIKSGGDFERFELSEDLGQHHHHLICESCGRVQDVELPEDLESQLHAAESKLVSPGVFQVTGHRVDFYGLCYNCYDVDLDVPPPSYFYPAK